MDRSSAPLANERTIGRGNRDQTVVMAQAVGEYPEPMSTPAPLRDRVAFALLVPSLAVPIIAMALAAWRMGHLDEAHLAPHPGIGLYYFAAMITLSATIFSMSINAVLVVRNHASLSERAIPLRRLAPHYAVALVVTAWAVQFCFIHMGFESLAFGIVLVAGSLFSFAVVSGDRKVQDRFEVVEIGRRARGVLFGYPFTVAIALAIGVFGQVTQNEVQIIAIALLGFLGLPWSGVSVLLWLPLVAISYLGRAPETALPVIFLVLAAVPAIANAALGIVFLRSTERRNTFINDFLEVPPFVDADSNTLAQ